MKATIIFTVLIMTLSCASMPFLEREFDEVGTTRQAFKFEDARMYDIGTVYHYTKSNLDGSMAASIDVYIAAVDRTESFKIYPGAGKSGHTDLVIALYDGKNVCVKSLMAYFVKPDGSRHLNAVFAHQSDNRYYVRVATENYGLATGHQPSFVYNFDLTDFNFFFRHLAFNRNPLTIGIVGLTADLRFVYSGTVEVTFTGESVLHENACLDYTIGGKAFNNRSGTLRVNKEGLYIEDITIGLPTNPAYTGFRLTLTGKEKMTPAEWEAFILTATKQALTGRSN